MGDNCVIYIPLPPEFSSLKLSIEVCPLHFPYKLALWYMCSANVGPRQVIWKLEEQRCFYLRYSGCCCLLSVIASIARVEMKRGDWGLCGSYQWLNLAACSQPWYPWQFSSSLESCNAGLQQPSRRCKLMNIILAVLEDFQVPHSLCCSAGNLATPGLLMLSNNCLFRPHLVVNVMHISIFFLVPWLIKFLKHNGMLTPRKEKHSVWIHNIFSWENEHYL